MNLDSIEQVREDINLNYSLEDIRAELDAKEWRQGDGIMCDDMQQFRVLYIGTVFGLTPSGKYYMPWAAGNVDLCPACKGSGDANVSQLCEYCGGVGKRNLASIAVRTGETIDAVRERLTASGTVVDANDRFNCPSCRGQGIVYPPCSYCGGLGSREAYLDAEWYAALEDKLDAAGLSLAHGEGDPCDLFITEYREI